MQMKQNGTYLVYIDLGIALTTGQRCCVLGSVCGVFGSYGSIGNRKQTMQLVDLLSKTARKVTSTFTSTTETEWGWVGD